MKNIHQTIEHTLLKPTATSADIAQLCQEALHHGFYAVCVNSNWVRLAANILTASPVKVVSTAAFPLGSCGTLVKCREIEYAIASGAHEVDYVINIGWVKDGDKQHLTQEFHDLIEAAAGTPLKVIIETCLLNRQEIEIVCNLAASMGIAFVKTSTGFNGGATIDDVKLIKQIVGKRTKVKASGGIRDPEMAIKMIEAGADRIGTSSSIAIVTALQSAEK